MATIHTLKGSYKGSLIDCLYWQASTQGGMPSVEIDENTSIDISEINISLLEDPHRSDEDLTPKQAMKWIARKLADDA